MNNRVGSWLWVACTACCMAGASAAGSGCAADEFQETPYVQDSATAAPRWTVDINRVVDGIFRAYRPRCMDRVRVGQTVEFRNYAPTLAANVTSIAGPEPLYSPTLRRPYNYVAADDPNNTACDVTADDGRCTQRPEWSYWRHTFATPGVYDWIDTHSGTPGRRVVDPYYGTVTFVGIDPNTPFGSICVVETDGSGCDGVCCSSDVDCTGNTQCIRFEFEAVGRCLTP